MRRRYFLILSTLLITLGTLTLESCFSSGPGYYGGPGPVVLGDYDDSHVWHDRYWWISHHHDWVHQHHPDWVANESPEEHQAFEQHPHSD